MRYDTFTSYDSSIGASNKVGISPHNMEVSKKYTTCILEIHTLTRAAALEAQQPLLPNTTIPPLFSNLRIELVIGYVVALGTPWLKWRASHLCITKSVHVLVTSDIYTHLQYLCKDTLSGRRIRLHFLDDLLEEPLA